MRKLLLAVFMGLVCTAAFAQSDYAGSLDATDPVFHRPEEGVPPTILSTVGTATHYDVISFTVVNPGMITFVSSSIWDNFGVLYGTAGFDPSAPLTNALLANDDFSGTNFGFTYDFTTPGTYYLVITSFKNPAPGAYSLTMTEAGVLPLKLTSFTAEKSATGNIIRWSTAEELNIDHFEVLHSLDGRTFAALPNAVTAATNRATGTNYSFTDRTPATSFNYYRLKVYEKSGKTSMSAIALVNNKKTGSTIIRLFPNPAVNSLFIETKGSRAGKANVTVMNVLGAVVYSRSYVINNQPVLSIDVSKLSAGKYFVKTDIDNEQTVMSFIKN